MAIKEALESLRYASGMLVLYGALASVLYFLGYVVYQLYIHPLAKFPGPKLAALTLLYEDFYQWSHEGTFPLALEQMHAKYGDFVRIGPDEIHVADPDCYDTIYNFSPDIDKYSGAGDHRSKSVAGLFGQASVDKSKLHRRPYNPPFSRPAVIKKEELIRDKIVTVVEALDNACGTDEVIDLSSYYRALTTDIIASFAFGKDMDLLHNLNKAERLYAVWRGLWRRMARFRVIDVRPGGWVEKFISWLPFRGTAEKNPASISAFLAFREEMKTYIQHTLDALKVQPKGTEESEASGQLPAFQEALRSRHVTSIHLAPEALFSNGTTVFLAGSETTASSMGAGAYHLLANPSILHRLQAELDKVWADHSPSWTDLEQVALLKGVVLEAMRLDCGVARRFPRVNWKSDTVLNDTTIIPRGCTMSMSHRFMFFNPKIFPDPQKFDPDRWTQSEEQTAQLSKHMNPFSKGTRQCLAYSIAQAELYMTYAEIHRRFDMELVDTTREDVDCTVDRILSFPKAGKMTVKVKVKGRRAS